MGIVYRATDRLTGETIALKQVRVPAEYLLFMSRPPETVSQNMQLALGANSKPWHPPPPPHHQRTRLHFVQTDTEPQPFYTMTYLPEGGNPCFAG
ncbi:MAG: hypothetical protein GY792_06385 [Gammaproteobacteria bacterium]|nr:hypothetical protein [Gammaproteobacteria bacterium]